MKRNMSVILISFVIFSSLGASGLELTVTTTPLERSYPVGEELELGYSLSWTEAETDHVLLPPTLPELDWGTAQLLSMTVRREGSHVTADILLGIIPSQTGRHNFPSLELKVVPLDVETGAEENLVPLPLSPSELITTEELTVAATKGSPFLLPVSLAVVVLILALVLWLLRRRQRAATFVEPERSLEEELNTLLHQARRHRLDGNYYETYRSLHALAVKCGEHQAAVPPTLLSRLEERMKDFGYRGKGPSETDLEGDFKDVEQLCARLRSHGTQGAI
jgi:nitrogen fixation-related uncharacterized protein